MNSDYVVIDTISCICINIISWDGTSPWREPVDCIAQISDGSIKIGDHVSYNGYAWEFIPVPLMPSGVSAIAGANQVELSWLPSDGSSCYNILRAQPSGIPTEIGTSILTEYFDRPLSSGVYYSYSLIASGVNGLSQISSEASAIPY